MGLNQQYSNPIQSWPIKTW